MSRPTLSQKDREELEEAHMLVGAEARDIEDVVERILAEQREQIVQAIEAESAKAWRAFMSSRAGHIEALTQGRYDGLVKALRIARGGDQ